MPTRPDLTLPLEQSNPTFEPHKTEDSTGHYILVTWPDGGTDRIGGLQGRNCGSGLDQAGVASVDCSA
jgi:hypothetical protein